MSKSLGNSFFVKDALERNLGEVVRFYLISSHYRANFNFSEDDLNAAKKRLDKIYRLKKRVLGIAANLSANEKFKNEFMSAMQDDLNTSKALAAVDEFVRSANDELDANPKDKAKKGEIAANLELIARVLGILQIDVFEYFQFGVSDEKRAYIEDLINQRNEAKAAKNYELSDKIRDMLAANGISLMDTPEGCIWEKI